MESGDRSPSPNADKRRHPFWIRFNPFFCPPPAAPLCAGPLRAAPSAAVARINRIADVCERHGVDLPAAAVQFVLGHPVIATACLGARSAAEVQRNATLLESSAPAALWTELKAQGLLREDAPVPA